ncbi:hypothetical protein E2562_000513 [Oryza meyeriana var. granulata]|uniref:Uncharacterized protein n=1 Tax=Oryza meyeriana var. granulata TaxID=110450 RepID=A0A6G1CCE6_9ORYZ|nr:hypothetical protein E2562_000513 [Oryza meyeriana var. granulata]
MAEAVAISSLSTKVAMALARTAALGVTSLHSIRSNIAVAEQELSLLRDHLSYGSDNWANQVHDVAFQLEDIADECCYLSGHGFARDCANAPAWLALSGRLRKLHKKLGQLSTAAKHRRHRNHVNTSGGEREDAIIAGRRIAENAHFMDKEEIIGFSDHMKQLVTWLAEDAEPRRTLVAVHGMGGVGKTTLVTSVYKEVGVSHFDCTAWVAVSQRFIKENLLMKILKELNRHSRGSDMRTAGQPSATGGDGDTDYRSLIAALREHLANKKYLVVLDDIWDETLWDDLQHAMPDNTSGSRVVITTRRSGVAMAAAPGRIMALEPLPAQEGWTLFCRVVFKDVPDHKCPSHLNELAGDMLQRCRGLPLAIVSVGKLLKQKHRTEFAWRNVQGSLSWVKNSEFLGIKEASGILNLSIDDLPYKLRKCFLSCSVYAEDFLMKRKILIRKWVAQGFIEEAESHGERRTMEDVADDYLEKLVERNLFQVSVMNEFGRAKRVLIHDLFKELINHRSKHEEGSVQFVECKVTMDSDIRVRHLALDKCTSDKGSISAAKLATLRSFHAYGLKSYASLMCYFRAFRLLTVLSLWFVEIKKLHSSVTSLHNLRYLAIRSTLVEEFPKDLGKLQKLQTLDAKWSMVQRIPSSLAKLKNLRHLILFKRQTADLASWPFPGTPVELPQGLQNLTSLQALKYVKADKMIVKSLAKLEQMKSLELFDVDASFAIDLSSSISKMDHLQRLGITNRNAEAVIDLESITQAPRKIQKLALSGRLATGELPGWTSSLTSLKKVQLMACEIAQESLLLLSSLPGLLHLSLVAAYREKKMTFADGSYPALQTLALHELHNLTEIEFQRGCLVELSELVLERCTRLTDPPRGMENLTRLQNLEFPGMGTELMDKPTNSMICQTPSRYLSWLELIKGKKTGQIHDLTPSMGSKYL